MMSGEKMRRNRGATLVLVTTIGVIVGILGLSMIELGYHARMMAVRDVEKVKARCAADAGLAEAFHKMQEKLLSEDVWDNDTLPSGTTTTLPGTNASYNYTISGGPIGGWQIDSTGTCGLTTQMVHAVIDVTSRSRGLGVEEEITVNVDAHFGPGTEIRTNSTAPNAMEFKAGVVLPGDVMFGPGGVDEDVIKDKASTIYQADRGPAESILYFPPVEEPVCTMVYSDPLTDAITQISLVESRQYPSARIPNSGTLEISAPTTPDNPVVVYIVGDMDLLQSSTIVVKAGSSLALYLGGDLTAGNSVAITNENTDPHRLKIYGLPTCESIDLKAQSGTHAIVYAPDADVDLYNGGNPPGTLYGAITAKSFEMKNGGGFYFDPLAAVVNIDDVTAIFEIDRWWED